MAALRIGNKVRSLRRREGMTQTQLAAQLEISPSYLNLIEHNQRTIPAHLLVKTAQIFKVELAAFGDESQDQFTADLQEILGDPLFVVHTLMMIDVRVISAICMTSLAMFM